MNANLYVVMEKPDEEDIKRIDNAILLLQEIIVQIGGCSSTINEDNPHFLQTVKDLKAMKEGKWMY